MGWSSAATLPRLVKREVRGAALRGEEAAHLGHGAQLRADGYYDDEDEDPMTAEYGDDK